MKSTNPQLEALIVPAIIMLAFWGFLASGYIQLLIMFGHIVTSLGVGLDLYGLLPNPEGQARPLHRVQSVPNLHHRLPAGGIETLVRFRRRMAGIPAWA